jgi:hypothetical protein
MNAIVGFSSLLKKPGLSKEKSESYIDIINANSNYLISLINDIIDLSRLEANDLQIEYREVDIQNLFESLKSMMDSYARNIGHAAIEIKYDISPSIDVIITDYVRIKQIMLNLLTNAVKYSEKGVVMFKCEYIQNYYMFSVSDEGVGIIDDFKEHIFERFYKFSHFEKKEHAGTGLGLAITYNLIERLGGEIWFDSTPGQGTNFYFTLPVLKNVRLGKL